MDYRKILSGFDEYFKQSQEVFGTPGCCICVTKDEELVMAEGFGYKNKELTDPVDADTQFFIASNTKGFTALSVAILVDEGKLDFHTPIKEYIPWFQMHDDYATHRVTLSDIFSHQTGLPGTQPGVDLKDGKSVQEKRREIVEKIRYIKPTYDIHTKHVYSSVMFTVAAYLVGEVTGRLWEEFVIKRIMEPLGMNHTYFESAKHYQSGNFSEYHYFDLKTEKLKNYGMDREEEERYNPFGAAGSVSTCANDMQNYMIMLANGGRYNNMQIVSEKNLKVITGSVFAQDFTHLHPYKELGNASAGMGWFRWGYRGNVFFEHGGFFGSIIAVIPHERIGVAIFGNLYSFAKNNIWALIFNIFDRLLGLEPIDWLTRFEKDKVKMINMAKTEEAKNNIKKIINAKTTHPLAAYCGVYVNDLEGTITVSQKNNDLSLQFNDHRTVEAEHYHYDVFRVCNEGFNYELFLQFKTDFQGQVTSLILGNDDNILVKQEK